MTKAFTSLSKFRCIADDVVIHDNGNIPDQINHVEQALKWCADDNIALIVEKYWFF